MQADQVERGPEAGFSCRFCGAGEWTTFVDLGMSPLCNTHVERRNLGAMEQFFPLHARVCQACFLVQLDEFVAPAEIFGEYAYFSSYADTWVDHARRYADSMRQRLGLDHSSLVIELASNDGYLLQHFVSARVPVLGIEPAANVAAAARARGVRTDVSFHGSANAARVAAEYGRADLVLGNNVLAHVPNLNDFVAGMKVLMKPDGVFTMEFPHLERLMEQNQFDTIYHEHFSYFSFITVEKVFAAHGLTLFDVEELPTHGGSIRIFGRHVEDGSKPVGRRVAELRARELGRGFDRIDTYRNFDAAVRATKRDILECLIGLKRQGRSIVGYGAPGKGNTLLNYCGIRSDFLDYTVDRNPYKQGKFTPGTHIAILPPEMIRETKPDYIFILPWNLRDEIMSQMSFVRDWGCRFIVPIPKPQILD
ncbi:MAG: methyltransferase domain-containing protein [Gammaproteobacteria bacterium]|nr:methyltransferase domain-containing protein [Gammaproteobacteria bacterium]MDE2347387.1 methyltransferase domain-containing protein [Gammaproteobacteria bacterium]